MAQTPWGDLPITDAHVHFFSYRFYAGLAAAKQLEQPSEVGALLNWEVPSKDPDELATRWLGQMARHGVRRICLIASAPGDEGSVSSAVAAHPDYFFGYFMLDPTQPDAAQRAAAAAKDPSLHAVCLFPAMHKFSVADERLQPVFQTAAASGLAVFVHCGALSVGVRKKLGLASDYDIRFSNPLDLHAVALQYPQIRFIIPHFGAGLLREALMLADLCPNVYFDTSSTNHWVLYEGLNLRTVFGRALDLLGPGRLLFGTDSSFFPRGWNAAILEQQATALYELGMDEPQAIQIFANNLERVLAPRLELTRSRVTSGARTAINAGR